MKVINLSEIREKKNKEIEDESLEDVIPISYHFYGKAAKMISDLSIKMGINEKEFINNSISLIKILSDAQEEGDEIIIRKKKSMGFLSFVTKERRLSFLHLEKQKPDKRKLILLKYLDRFKPRK